MKGAAGCEGIGDGDTPFHRAHLPPPSLFPPGLCPPVTPHSTVGTFLSPFPRPLRAPSRGPSPACASVATRVPAVSRAVSRPCPVPTLPVPGQVSRTESDGDRGGRGLLSTSQWVRAVAVGVAGARPVRRRGWGAGAQRAGAMSRRALRRLRGEQRGQEGPGLGELGLEPGPERAREGGPPPAPGKGPRGPRRAGVSNRFELVRGGQSQGAPGCRGWGEVAEGQLGWQGLGGTGTFGGITGGSDFGMTAGWADEDIAGGQLR